MSHQDKDKNNVEQSEHERIDEHDVRVNKVQEMREQGIEPWPGVHPINASTYDVHEDYQADVHDKTYELAGRIMNVRAHGKSIFCNVQDRAGSLQIYLKKDLIGEEAFQQFIDYIDVGDLIWYTGTPFVTKTGELSIKVTSYELMSKCLRPLPEKFHGLTDREVRYRQRYLDLIMNEETRERFRKRSDVIKFLRKYLDDHDFLEVETPMLHPIPGGAAARPFVTHHNALDTDLYLRVAPELYLKRLVIGGFERVYEINRNFRNEGVSTKHNPEFTMLEFYMAYQDYHYMMNFIENMIKQLAYRICDTAHVPFGEHYIDLHQPFARMNAYEALLQYAPVSAEQLEREHIDATCHKHNVSITEHMSYTGKVFALFEEIAEQHLIQPTFIIDFPIEISPLSKRDKDDPSIAARFELYIAGMEISNGFNELNEPFDQAERFKEQAAALDAGEEESMHYDADYVRALEYGLPPTVGVGIGIDRLVMLLTDTQSIREVILFPTLRPKSA